MRMRRCGGLLGILGVAGLLAGSPALASAQPVRDSLPIQNVYPVGCDPNQATRVNDLIKAITDANSNSPAIVELAAGCVYTLTSANNTGVFGGNGLPVITGDVTIRGAFSVIERDSTAPEFRILEVDRGGSLTVAGVTVRDGAVSTVGGCYLADGGSLALTGSPVRDCQATQGGGGVAVIAGGSATVRGGWITGCTSNGPGGGIELMPGIQPTTTTSGDSGQPNSVEVEHSVLAHDSAPEGGAVAIAQGTDVAGTLGSARGARLSPGTRAWSLTGGVVELVSDYLAGDEATSGGAIDNSGGYLLVMTSKLLLNVADGDGGAIWSDGDTAVRGSVIGQNVALGDGGAIYNDGDVLLRNSIISSNRAGDGGGIYNGGNAVAIVSIIAGNIPDNCAPPSSVPGCLG